MIGNENRREIAKALCDLVDDYLPHDPDDDDVLKALGIEGGDYPGTSDRCGVIRLADLIDRPTCRMADDGDFMPHHEFKRMVCSECGGLHWEHPNPRLPQMRYCPWCSAEVIKNA